MYFVGVMKVVNDNNKTNARGSILLWTNNKGRPRRPKFTAPTFTPTFTPVCTLEEECKV